MSIPIAPSNLTAIGISSTQVKIAWHDNSTNENGFRILRSSNGVTWTLFALTGANVIACTDMTVAASTTYYYRVRAFNSAGLSAWSNTATVVTPALNAPQILQLYYNDPHLTNPPLLNGINLNVNTSYTFTAQVNSYTTKVKFNRDNGGAIISDTAYPFTFTYKFSSTGAHTLQVTPINSAGVNGTAITINFNIVPPPTAVPVITSSLTVSATKGVLFEYQTTATHQPTFFSHTGGLPFGLTMSQPNGVIYGVPTSVGIATAFISAYNSFGTSPLVTWTITVSA